MKVRYLLHLFLIFTLFQSALASDSEPPRPQGRRSVGLVLSGGGARGVAHIGVIRALEEHGVPIDYITGTSMGAIVGGLYAAGYSTDEMMQLLASRDFLDAATGVISPDYTYQFFVQPPTPAIINVGANVGRKIEISPLLPTSLISPTPMNFTFMEIFAPYTGQCHADFNRLFVPFRCVASDIIGRRPVVFRSGQLGRAVRASMTFPIVFKPQLQDSMLLYDGGIYDNFPVGVMRDDFHPDFILGIDVHTGDTIKGFPDVMTQLDMLVMQPNSYDVPPEQGMKIRMELSRYSLLDFDKSPEIEQIGYDEAMSQIDSIAKRAGVRVDTAEVKSRRRAFKASTPPIVFDSVKVTGQGSPNEKEYIASLFKLLDADTFGIRLAHEAYGMALSTGRLKDLDPEARYNPQTGRFTLVADVTMKGNLNFGFGGYITSSTNSMLYVSASYKPRTFRTLDASMGVWIGQSYYAGQLIGQWMLRDRRHAALTLEAVAWSHRFNENDKMFYDTEAPAFIREAEFFARLTWARPTGFHSWVDAGIGYGHHNDRFYNNDMVAVGSDSKRNSTRRDFGQFMFRWQYNTLDAPWFPLEGRQIKVMAQGIAGNLKYTPGASRMSVADAVQTASPRYLQFEAVYRDYFPLTRHWTFGVESDILYSTQKLLHSYTASLVNAPAFRPTASSYNVFNPDLRANAFISAGMVPVYRFSERVSLRGGFYAFVPMRSIRRADNGEACYSRWFSGTAFFGEAALSVRFKYATLSAYGNYQTTDGNKWGAGVSFGVFIPAPNMLRP